MPIEQNPTGEEALAILATAKETGCLPEGFIENQLKSMRGGIQDDTHACVVEAKAPTAELSPEQVWIGEFKTRFDDLPHLHKGIQWANVEKSLKVDPESMRKLQALDEKGHNMNVFGEENDEFIFVSGWSDCEKVSLDHRNITHDPEGQKLAEKRGSTPNGNAVSIIAKIMGVKEDEAGNYLADPKFHEQLRREIEVNGWAWLKTDTATRQTGYAFCGGFSGIFRRDAGYRDDYGSFRVELRVKKA